MKALFCLTRLAEWKAKTRLITWKYDGLPIVMTFALLILSRILGSENDAALYASPVILHLCIFI